MLMLSGMPLHGGDGGAGVKSALFIFNLHGTTKEKLDKPQQSIGRHTHDLYSSFSC